MRAANSEGAALASISRRAQWKAHARRARIKKRRRSFVCSRRQSFLDTALDAPHPKGGAPYHTLLRCRAAACVPSEKPTKWRTRSGTRPRRTSSP